MLRRFKKACDRKGIVKECRDRQYFEKPASIRNQKNQLSNEKENLKQRKIAIRVIEESKISNNTEVRVLKEDLQMNSYTPTIGRESLVRKKLEIKVRR